MDAQNRNYKDAQHKPECICALTSFWGMCGFRPAAEIKTLIAPVWPKLHGVVYEMLEGGSESNSLRVLFTYLMRLDKETRWALVDHVVTRSKSLKEQNIAYEWILRLNDQYPHDIGVLSPLLLNMVHLQPGQALFLPARQLHAYLDGLGIELMANSDNVLRGGLTPKHVDVPELIRILDFEPYIVEFLLPRVAGPDEKQYHSRAQEFILSTLASSAANSSVYEIRSVGPAILLCTQGETEISWPQGKGEMVIRKGQSVFIPDSVKTYTLKGDAKFYKASVNI